MSVKPYYYVPQPSYWPVVGSVALLLMGMGAAFWFNSVAAGPWMDHHLFGRLTWLGQPVYGFTSTTKGSPTDSFGRNVYLDTFDSAYGPGWKRENSFLTHRGTGAFCYGLYPHEPYPGYPAVGRRPAGKGQRYRATVVGPGVLPDVAWEGAPTPYDAALDGKLVEQQRSVYGSDSRCKPV